jgi:hypothetical protein
MKSSPVKLGVVLIFIGFAVFTYAEVWGADWKQWIRIDGQVIYYDTKSITCPSKNIVRVWTKYDFDKLSGLDYQLTLYEIDCKQRIARELSVSTYTKEGKLLTEGSKFILKDWFLIEPESMAEVLLKKVCK